MCGLLRATKEGECPPGVLCTVWYNVRPGRLGLSCNGLGALGEQAARCVPLWSGTGGSGVPAIPVLLSQRRLGE